MTTTSKPSKPSKLTLRAYQVGFGDCFLLTFHYPKAKSEADRQRHVLIDFGSMQQPKDSPPGQMRRVAEDIREVCGGEDGKLHIVVATHRHKDHISGFETDKKDETGTIIRGLRPEVVIQPWTENPSAKEKAKGLLGLAADPARAFRSSPQAAHVGMLHDMNFVADVIGAEVSHLSDRSKFRKTLDAQLLQQIDFFAADNGIANPTAVENLNTMAKAKNRHYVNFGYKLDLSGILPGVKVHVLGPPTIEQYPKVKGKRNEDDKEFWMLQQATAKAFWGSRAATGEKIQEFVSGGGLLFPDAGYFRGDHIPAHNRWFIRQMRAVRGEELLKIVRIMDNYMNNTSVILLFEVAGKKFLFPGDAQIENWEYALKDEKQKEKTRELLKDTFLYKVGHHGSRNATPKTLWKMFENKSEADGDPKRLKTLVSTMKDNMHSGKGVNSEVPRKTLVTQLKKLSDYNTTETAWKQGKLCVEIEVPL